ncbi:MAG: L-threonine 3-dehydrogenase [Acidobacteria bacterium]|nr:L-threonine 3-dehydrogenase [Acidobacteriota bacterium]
MPDTMEALVKASAGRGMALETRPRPACGENDVIIRIRKTGICGTDVHIYQWDHWAASRVHPPLVVGHEFVGIIEEVGAEVDHLKPGDLVSGEGHIGCGVCYFCRTGQGHICRQMQIIGVDRDGCFAHHFCFPAANVWKVRPEIPADAAAIFDPYGNAMHTVMAQSVAGKTVAIIGVGAIGLMACKIAAVAGALSVFAVDPQEHKRSLALRYGASEAFDPNETAWKQRLLRHTRESSGVDVVLEMSGSRSGLQATFELVRPGGEVALLGIPPSDVTLNLAESIIFKAITLRGINGRLMFETWYQCEQFLLEHKVDLLPLITHRFPYREYQEAFAVLERGEAVKVILEWG